MRLILASASPRRRELLKEIYPLFEIMPTFGEEKAEALPPEELVKRLAFQKAEEIFLKVNDPTAVVLGADTVVAYGGKIFGKPKSKRQAETMLKTLSGKTHEVLTGVCFLYTDPSGEKRQVLTFDRTEVTFYKLSQTFIHEYVESGSPMDKAGAYGIQDGGLVEKLQGSYSNVVGLPVELCDRLFAEIQEVVQ